MNPWFPNMEPTIIRSGLPNREGWITSDGPQQAARVALWVVEEKKVLQYSLVGFLKTGLEGTKAIESWLDSCWGKMVIRVKMLDERAALLQFESARETEVLRCAEDGSSSPFVAIDRWMEEIRSPPFPRWVRMSGVPMHAWRERIFRLLGDCLGYTVEVKQDTISKEVLIHGRVKVLL